MMKKSYFNCDRGFAEMLQYNHKTLADEVVDILKSEFLRLGVLPEDRNEYTENCIKSIKEAIQYWNIGTEAIEHMNEAIESLEAYLEETEAAKSCEELKNALLHLKDAFIGVLQASDYETEFDGLKYPFDCNFKEMVNKVIDWVDFEII
ncbi:hypothetical protein CLHUN_02420 [Ruminiclostridium hungatei]|uniref:Uncharacterized protein n=1 Tax=Ruminiclostridium hungatei TaxID=48256 RepID=A0A1V4SSI2_RUMHU|nr:hypothetical protein [Ruminiclostridium hungatei]OPX46426.1 hypothetical protein CLHUN_02420 [Ruminiclostridium hungatei]